MSEDVIDLTSGLYQFMLAAEQSIAHGRQAAAEAQEHLLERARVLSQRFAQARQSVSERMAERYEAIAHGLGELATGFAERHPRTLELQAAWQSLGQQYEALLASVRAARLPVAAGVKLGHIKPRNYYRNLFHLGMGVGSVLLYELAFGRATMIVIGSVILGLFVLMDLARRLSPACNQLFMKRLFKPIARPSEAHKIPSATWYMASLLIGVVVFPQHAIALAALVLALGDPAASLAGKKWGRLKLIGSKSWVGTGAFILVSAIAGTIFLSLVLPGLGFGHRLGIAVAVAAAGAAAELLSGRIDDNLSIPLVTGLLATLLM